MQYLENAGALNRELEFLPNNDTIAERLAAGDVGMSRPELAVLVSYAKMTFYDKLLASDVPDDPWLEQVLCDYFPEVLSQKYPEQLKGHRLRREIIATVLTNEFVNRMGPSFAFKMEDELGTGVPELATAFVVSKELFDMNNLWGATEALDNAISAPTQTELHRVVRGLVERSIHWLIRSRRANQSISDLVLLYRRDIMALSEALPAPVTASNKEALDRRANALIEQGVPAELAVSVSHVIPLSSAFDISEVAHNAEADVVLVAESRLRADLHNQQRKLTAELMSSSVAGDNATERLEQWFSNGKANQQAYHRLMGEVKAAGATDFSMLSVAVNEVHSLLQTTAAID